MLFTNIQLDDFSPTLAREEKQMDMDDEGASQASPALSDANTPAEFPVSVELALELAFSMLSFVLRNDPTRKASPFARSIPWHDLAQFFANPPPLAISLPHRDWSSQLLAVSGG